MSIRFLFTRTGQDREHCLLCRGLLEVLATAPKFDALSHPGHAIMALSVGSTAPAFSCTAHTGATISLSDYAGKKVILWFYPRAATGG